VTEADVALTDYGLALECAVFCLIARSRPAADERLRRWWIVFFASIGLGSLFGGTVHGFFHDERSWGYAILWPATLLAIGVTSVATWTIDAFLLPAIEENRKTIRKGAIGLFIAYAIGVLFAIRSFLIAILIYLPPTAILFFALLIAYSRTRERAIAYGVLGVALTFVAAYVQQARIAIDPVYFNHNALYHVLQAIALLLIFLAARVVRVQEQRSGRPTYDGNPGT
jgi:MFS family permease